MAIRATDTTTVAVATGLWEMVYSDIWGCWMDPGRCECLTMATKHGLQCSSKKEKGQLYCGKHRKYQGIVSRDQLPQVDQAGIRKRSADPPSEEAPKPTVTPAVAPKPTVALAPVTSFSDAILKKIEAHRAERRQKDVAETIRLQGEFDVARRSGSTMLYELIDRLRRPITSNGRDWLQETFQNLR